MSDRTIKLKPCPFCGGEAHVKITSDYDHYYIGADHTRTCAIKPNTASLNSKVLRTHRKKWNTRWKEKTNDSSNHIHTK